jgi:general secretion pathway protein B
MDATATAKDNSQLPSWYELPQDFRNRLDLPRLDLHAYSEEPQNRFILVNLKKYREGEKLESGLVLEEILPDGMVMSYQGERFLVEK